MSKIREDHLASLGLREATVDKKKRSFVNKLRELRAIEEELYETDSLWLGAVYDRVGGVLSWCAYNEGAYDN